MSSLLARRRSFFKGLLGHGVSRCDLRPWFPTPEAKLPEQPLTLTHAQLDVVGSFQMITQKLSVPHVLPVAELPGRLAKILSDSGPRANVQGRRTARTATFLKACKPAPLKALHPILDGSSALAEQPGDLSTRKSRRDEQNSVQSVIIAGLLGTQDLLLQGYSHNLGVLDLQLSHIGLLSGKSLPENYDMRNYLRRNV
jgi:hypothetical protein